MAELMIILDKSVVYGLKNSEVDSLDRYFFLIVPPIVTKEILADLSKEAEEPDIVDSIGRHSYRISGRRGIMINYREILLQSLIGNEVPMEGKFFPAGAAAVRSESGSLGTKIETTLEDQTIYRWERRQFTNGEKDWAARWRRRMERPINPVLYTDNIAKVGLRFRPPESDEELAETTDSLLSERKLQARLFPLLAREHRIPIEIQGATTLRWFKEGCPMFEDFAPYAFFCLRSNFLWALGSTNPRLFKPDKNDRKDLEYCYSLPYCEIFSSNDNKHKRLVPSLLRPDQSFVDGEVLKKDLRRLSEEWDALSREERIRLKSARGDAPPEYENSIVFQLWKKHRNKIPESIPQELLKVNIHDTSIPEEERREMTFADWMRTRGKEVKAAGKLSNAELEELKRSCEGVDPEFVVRKTKISKERLLKLYPHLTREDLDKADRDE